MNESPAMLCFVPTSDPDQDERLRSILRSVVTQDFGGNYTRAGSALGVSTALVSLVLDGSKRPGPKLIKGLADHTGRTLDDLYGRASSAAEAMPRSARRPRVVTFGELDNWTELRDAAQALDQRVESWCFDRLATETAILTREPTPAMVRDLARVVRRYFTPSK